MTPRETVVELSTHTVIRLGRWWLAASMIFLFLAGMHFGAMRNGHDLYMLVSDLLWSGACFVLSRRVGRLPAS